jgi:uncharacterized phage protein gp47/JayE
MFERKSMEQLTDEMIAWARATSPKLTDYRKGSVTRTFIEAVAKVVEGSYNRFYVGLKSIIENNLYAVIGFDKELGKPSTGRVVFTRVDPATEAIFIPIGTEVVAVANDFRAPLVFRTTADVYMEVGYTSVQVDVVSSEVGIITNVLAGDITDFVQRPFGIDAVTNIADFVNGTDEESPETQKLRFQDFMDSNSKGTLQAIEYGTKQAIITSVDGNVSERIIQAIALEYPDLRKGEVDVYAWNGVGDLSTEIRSEVQRILLGYYDESGRAIYGYKNGGTLINLYSAIPAYVTIRLNLTLHEWASEAYVKSRIQREIDSYFQGLRLGQTLIHSDLQARLKLIDGVLDIRLECSTDDGVVFTTDNVAVSQNNIIVPNGAPTYV